MVRVVRPVSALSHRHKNIVYRVSETMKVLTELFADLLLEDLNEEVFMARTAGLGLNIYPTKVKPAML